MDSNRPDASTVGVARHYSSIRILNNSQAGRLSHANSDGPKKRQTKAKKRKSARGKGKSLPSSFTILIVIIIMQKQSDFLNSS